MKITSLAILAIIGSFALIIAGCGEEEGPIQPPPPAPPEYADKHMPAGWWADEKIIAEGKEVFEGVKNIDVNCSSCHGKDGKPVKAGARDFRKTERMKLYSDSVWFWRISEGVPNTKMKAWKSKLPEEDRWKAMPTNGLSDSRVWATMWPGRIGSRWLNSGNQRLRDHTRPAGPPPWPAVARLRQRPLPKMAPRRGGNNRSMRGVLKIVLVVAGLLVVRTAGAFAPLP